MYVSVIGGKSCTKDIYDLAEKFGEEIGKIGGTIITGGLGGVMEAVSKGAKAAGGMTIGILPSENRDDGNPFLDMAIVTGFGQARNVLVILNGDIVVAIDGEYGTLSEIALALKYGKKVLGLKTWDIPAIETYSDVDKILEKIKTVSR
jgi:uncharacterized protein (TIGR00725 family)